jgi:signal transduction histidine kinase
VLSKNPDAIKAFNPSGKPIPITLTNAPEQVLAIRYALQPHVRYSTNWGYVNLGLRIEVNTAENAYNRYQQELNWNNKVSGFKVGLFGIFAVLYLFFYLFYPIHKVNLYFSLYAFSQALTWGIVMFYNEPRFIANVFLIGNFILVIMVTGYLFMLQAIYVLMEQKRSWPFYALVALGVISIPVGVFIYGWGWLLFGYVFTSLVSIDITRIAFMAVRNRKKGAWILATGSISYLVSWTHFTLLSLQVTTFLPSLDSFNIAWISIPVAVSIYLGYDFAQTLRSLQVKLIEVENLSQEKQQILAAQKEVLEKEVDQRTAELQGSLQELKATQAQLIQSEKMASLGELAAGIAHEIQNPLNFVNNFSELNSELVQEMVGEIEKGNLEEIKFLAGEIKENEQKINQHGKRADAIVKSMLQHSRTSKGERQETDVNALVDEYLRLAYHGFRAKDKSFSAIIHTHFDDAIDRITIVPQEIGRVLLNLFNNAFYAVNEKGKQQIEGYEPIVSISTKRLNDRIEIQVRDNGMEISKSLLNKIFQPFFTTKPAGQGTGLGLSLSYDVIKSYGGEISVVSGEGEGTTFVVQLPT